MSFFPPNKAKGPFSISSLSHSFIDPQKDRRILSFMEQDLDQIAASSPSSDNILDEDYDDAPIKKLKTEKQTSKTSIILIDDSEDSSSSLTSNQNNNRQTGYNNNQQNLPPPHLSPYNSQPLPYFPQYFSSEYPKINLLNQHPYQQNPPPTAFHSNSFPQGNNRPPMPKSQENSSYQPIRPGPPNSFNSQFRPQEPQIPLSNQKSSPVNSRSEESKGIAMETEKQNKPSTSQENIQKMPVSELAKRASIAKKTSKGRPKEGEGAFGNGAAYIQPIKTPEKANSDRPDLQKPQKDAIKTVDKSLKLQAPGKPQDPKDTSKISDTRAQNTPRSPITPPGSASKTAKKPGSGASVPVFARQRTEEQKNDEKRSPEKVPKKQRHMKNISLFQPSNQELHELIAKELNEDDEIEVENELTLNELIVNYSKRHKDKKCASLRLHEYFELIEAPRHKPEEYPVNYKQFL